MLCDKLLQNLVAENMSHLVFQYCGSAWFVCVSYLGLFTWLYSAGGSAGSQSSAYWMSFSMKSSILEEERLSFFTYSLRAAFQEADPQCPGSYQASAFLLSEVPLAKAVTWPHRELVSDWTTQGRGYRWP